MRAAAGSGTNADATAGHDDHCAGLKRSLVPLQEFLHRRDLLVNAHFHESQDCLMRTLMDKDQLPEVLVLGHEDSTFP